MLKSGICNYAYKTSQCQHDKLALYSYDTTSRLKHGVCVGVSSLVGIRGYICNVYFAAEHATTRVSITTLPDTKEMSSLQLPASKHI